MPNWIVYNIGYKTHLETGVHTLVNRVNDTVGEEGCII